MFCENCKYYKVDNFVFDGKEYTNCMCDITHVVNPQACTYFTDNEKVKDMNICYNCKYWYGGGDWGLSCEKNYYNCSTNGFDEVCELFERK